MHHGRHNIGGINNQMDEQFFFILPHHLNPFLSSFFFFSFMRERGILYFYRASRGAVLDKVCVWPDGGLVAVVY
jgi:hypothetical protein